MVLSLLTPICSLVCIILWGRLLPSRPVAATLLVPVMAPTLYYAWQWLALLLFYLGFGYSG